MNFKLISLALIAAGLLFACQKEQPQEPVAPPSAPEQKTVVQAPPTPPVFEDFEGEPKLSLFPRAGDVRPEDNDQDKLPYWMTFIDHLVRTSGVMAIKEDISRHIFALRSINTIDSVAFFSPLAVTPDTSYDISFSIKTDLPEGAEAGIGILEFDQFLWVADQFTKTQLVQHQTGIFRGPVFTGKHDWQEVAFKFHSGPKTGMIHLLLYREGPHDRAPVLFDNIRIEVSSDK